MAALDADGAREWGGLLQRTLHEEVERFDAGAMLLPMRADGMDESVSIDWVCLPTRAVRCSSRRAALELWDVPADQYGLGGRQLQDEYLEWRVVRDGERVVRIEVTTELGEYWGVLAGYKPVETMRLVRAFARDESVPYSQIYGGAEEDVQRVTPQERARRFVATMLSAKGASPYNDGRLGLCCMMQPTNSLRALVRLAAAAATKCVGEDRDRGEQYCRTASEAAALLQGAADMARASDPLLVERIAKLVYEGRSIAFDDPLGVYIAGVEHTRLRTPSGENIPPEWFTLSRGEDAQTAADGRQRFQRAVLEVPEGEGIFVSDLIDVATGQRVEHGGQVAELIEAVVRLNVSAQEAIAPRVTPKPEGTDDAAADGCEDVRRLAAASARPREHPANRLSPARSVMDEDRLQPGIYFRSKERPPAAFAFVVLDVSDGASAGEAARALGAVMSMLAGLSRGEMEDLQGQPEPHSSQFAEQFAGLAFLIGYGARVFDQEVHRPALTKLIRPDYLVCLAGEQPAFPALPWTAPGSPNNGEGDVAVQLTAASVAAVTCAAVEVWKTIAKLQLPLSVKEVFQGFGRHDGRGWLGFHDGVSNGRSQERVEAIRSAGDPGWMDGGTYLAFLRMRVDLEAWNGLPRTTQELLVGRHKLHGAPLMAVERGERGELIPVAREPLPQQANPAEPSAWIDPPQTTDPILEASHIHRANQNRASMATPGGLRIFRQGYEFFDGFDGGAPQLGLNFVSFQRDLGVLQHLLHLPGWLGDVNFGGSAAAGVAPMSFITVDAGGLYAVPRVSDPFAGAGLFT